MIFDGPKFNDELQNKQGMINDYQFGS
jgi:hypothetical protein